MNKLFRGVFLLLSATSLCCFFAAIYLFFVKELQILSAIFLVLFTMTLYLAFNLANTNNTFLSIDEKRIIKNIFPPFLSLFLSKISSKKERRELLFSGSEDLFREHIEKSNIYGEYGMGESTIFAMNYENLKIFSVDSDIEWTMKIQAISDDKKHFLKYIDLGVVQNWGFPVDYSKKDNIKLYLDYIWSMQEKPDLVLIDGRFRVASFLTSLKECKEGTKIIFDDYKMRPIYHIVEEFIKPNRYFGNQALFIILSKKDIDITRLEKLIDKFEYVMD